MIFTAEEEEGAEKNLVEEFLLVALFILLGESFLTSDPLRELLP